MLNYTDYFSATYAAARDKFRQALREAGVASTSYRHPTAVGAQGEELTIDVAHLGNVRAPRQLIMLSGTHGLEGFAGSALQVAWLKQRRPTAHTGVLLVHGLNPYGFSHGSRTNLEGVDLNRNFVDHAQSPLANPRYAELHPLLLPRRWDTAERAACQAGIEDFRRRHGDDAYFEAFAGGQYQHVDGTCFGGFAPAWENDVLRQVVTAALGQARQVAVIDWHTGIGDYAKPFCLNFATPGSTAQRLTDTWWHQAGDARPHGRARPAYQGLVFRGIEACLPHAEVAGGVIELGTRGPVAGDQAIRQDLWLRNFGEQLQADARAQLHADLLDSLNPVSYQWREPVLEHGLALIDATHDGLARW